MTTRTVGPLHLDVVEPSGAAQVRRPDILCIHGLFAAGWVFDDLLAIAAARGHRAAALSLRGHAPSPPDPRLGRLSVGDFVQDAAAAAATLDRPIVIGHSLGGLLAMLIAKAGLVRAAVLVAPAPPRGINVLSPPLLARMGRYVPDLLLSRPFRPRDADLDALVLNQVPAAERAALRSRFIADSGRAARDAAIGLHAVRAGEITVPMFVMGGDHDRFIPIGVTTRVAKRFGAPLRIAPGHGHFLFAEPGWEPHVAAIFDWIDSQPLS